ncbi:hypothetical protein JVU11DRAFT_6725 [Chiua virens]|nr:hypothetical protein JVU11DRAFT_6725 [Chiua virens]
MATKTSSGYASSSSDYPYYTYQYWLTPGRIVGIAVGMFPSPTALQGAVVLILLIVAMIVYACRRRRAARETTIFSAPPQSYPNPTWRQNDQSLIDAPGSPGWYYPPSNAPFDSTKSNTPSERVSRTVTYGEVQRVPTSDHVQRPASLSEVMRTTVPRSSAKELHLHAEYRTRMQPEIQAQNRAFRLQDIVPYIPHNHRVPHSPTIRRELHPKKDWAAHSRAEHRATHPRSELKPLQVQAKSMSRGFPLLCPLMRSHELPRALAWRMLEIKAHHLTPRRSHLR